VRQGDRVGSALERGPGQQHPARPTTLKVLSLIINASEEEITVVIQVFRKPSRSFLMPPIEVEIDGNSVIDISHESLMRVWNRLSGWAYEEAQSAQTYLRLANTSILHAAGRANLWRDPDLQLALDWKKKENPTMYWAMQYHSSFDVAMAFLQKSRQARDYEAAEVRFTRKLRILRTIILFCVLGLLSYNLWGPLTKKSIGEYTFGDKVITNLRKQDIITLPANAINALRVAILLSTPEIILSGMEEEGKRLRDVLEPEAEGQDVIHIQKAIDKYPVWLSDVVVLKRPDPTAIKGLIPMEIRLRDSLSEKYRYSKNFEIDEFDPIFVLDLQRIRAQHKDLATVIEKEEFRDLLLKQGIMVLSESPKLPEAEVRRLRLVPNKIEVLRPMGEQSRKMSLVMQNNWVADKLLKSPVLVRPIDGILTIFAHFLGYFLAVFGLGMMYRKLAFNPEGGASQHPFLHATFSRARVVLNLFKSHTWKVMFSLALILFAAYFIILGMRTGLDLMMIVLGFTIILIVPLDPLLRPARAVRLKVMQGLLLQLGGFYLLAVCIVNFIDPQFSYSRTWVLLLLSIGLVIAGRTKVYLTAKEKLLRATGRMPVLYFCPSRSRVRGWKRFLGRIIGHRYRSVDEKILSPVFGTLGPFIRLRSLKQLTMFDSMAADTGTDEGRHPPTGILPSVELVIIQVEERLSEALISKVERALESLRPEQLLLYFSQQIEDKNLSTTYYQFVKETEGIFPSPFPPSNNLDRLIAFKDGWSPYTAGAIVRPKIWWAKLLPFLARRVDAFRRRRSFVQHLKPFLDQRNLSPEKARLYSDFSIGLAGFYILGFGIPAGIMIFRNYWLMKRRGAAIFGLVAPFLAFIFAYFLAAVILTSGISGLGSKYWQSAGLSLLILIIFGSPFATYKFWRRFSGRKIRYQVAFSGSAKPWWKNILVIFLTNAFMYGLILVPTFFAESYAPTPSVASTKVWEGYDLASAGDLEKAILVWQEAQALDPGIDLNPYTEVIDKDPRIVANNLAATARVWKGSDLASRGDVEGAITAFKEALDLDPAVDLDPQTTEFENDPVMVAERLAAQASAKVWEGYDLAASGDVDGAIVKYQEAQSLDPEIDLDPLTTDIEKNPADVAMYLAAASMVLEGYEHAKKGEAEQAELLYEEAGRLNPKLEENAEFWNNVGWWYSLGGHPERAVIPSENAVMLAAQDSSFLGYCLDTRGLARALTGNLAGAIEDYEAAMSSQVYMAQEDYKAKTREWVAAMRKGEQPITEQVLQELRKE
jgi:tetratricopeptide (TPR) repeat protein